MAYSLLVRKVGFNGQWTCNKFLETFGMTNNSSTGRINESCVLNLITALN
jgi:hypothetical protein